MKKKMYEKPSMEVLECEQEVQLRAGSAQVDATRESTWTEEDVLLP